MTKVKYKLPEDDKVHVYEFDLEWMGRDLTFIANEIAEKEFNNSGSDLVDPFEWPRIYKIFSKGKWHKVKVSMEFKPCFYPKIIEEESEVQND